MTTSRIPLARLLFTRLASHNVTHIYGVPGDYTLRALDHLPASGLHFTGCCNELNAAYAADGYARSRRFRHPSAGSHSKSGLGAVFTTYGVGELSAANAVAGSYAEHVPVVHIVGTPGRKALRNSAAEGGWEKEHQTIHHTLGDGRVSVFREMAEKFTVAQLNLADVPEDEAADQIDHVLAQAVEHSRPVYIELPSDKPDVEVPDYTSQTDKDHASSPSATETHAARRHQKARDTASKLLQRLYTSHSPLLLIDRSHGIQDLRTSLNAFIRSSGLPALVMPSGLGMVDSDIPNYYGVHSGKIGYIDTTEFVKSSDLILSFGGMFSDTQTLGWEAVPKRENLVMIEKGRVEDAQVQVKDVLDILTKEIHAEKLPKRDTTALGDFRQNKYVEQPPEQAVDQTNFYLALNPYLRANDTILLANATPILGGRDFILPPSTQVIVSGMWFSIGHMLPAALGAAQARSSSSSSQSSSPGRTILLDGDGSFQVTAQELSTIIHNRVPMTIFIINNGGYTYERLIHGREEAYNEIAPWDYLRGPAFFGADSVDGYPVRTHRVKTYKDLSNMLESKEFEKGEGLTLVDVRMGVFDIPAKAQTVFDNTGKGL